jgi:3-hydroxyisobutyrate dehydrogenase-like beta-hydroxyacid dehydrogenase
MAFQRVAILSIGEMGYHWARLLSSRGVEVLTYLRGRSEATHKRAEGAGVRVLPSMKQLVSEADLIVSIVIPSAAPRVAASVAKTLGKTPKQGVLFVDANAISPITAEQIDRTFKPAGVSFVDGCIIGSATRLEDRAIVYVSGPEAETIKGLEAFGLRVEVLGPSIGQASAFKILYAGLTKGLQSLLVELLLGAQKYGLLEELIQRYNKSHPGLVDGVGHSIAGLTVHGARRAEEMVELTKTMRAKGLQPIMAPAARRVLAGIGRLRLGEGASRERAESLREALDLFLRHGLLQTSRSSIEKRRAESFELNPQRGD